MNYRLNLVFASKTNHTFINEISKQMAIITHLFTRIISSFRRPNCAQNL